MTDPNWEAFQRALPDLLQDPTNSGQFALVSGGQVDSVWPTQAEALVGGYDRFGLNPFLVPEITATPRVYYRRFSLGVE